MSLTVYLANSVAEAEMSVLWEFQANSAAHGIKVQLARYRPVSGLTASRKADIDRCDAVVAVLTRPSAAIEAEVQYAAERKKPVIAYTLPDVQVSLPANAVRIVLTRETNASDLLAHVAKQLEGVPPSDDGIGPALGAVVGIGALLFLLFFLSKEK